MNHDHPIQGTSASVKAAMKRAIDYDDSRASMPYEHCATLTASFALIAAALLTPRRELAVAQGAVAGVLLFRSLSGRDGLRRWVGADRARPRINPMAVDPGAEPGYSGA